VAEKAYLTVPLALFAVYVGLVENVIWGEELTENVIIPSNVREEVENCSKNVI